MSASKIQCTLCDQFISSDELHTQRELETHEIVEYTINMIKARHPEWTKDDPTCRICWDYYRSLPTT